MLHQRFRAMGTSVCFRRVSPRGFSAGDPCARGAAVCGADVELAWPGPPFGRMRSGISLADDRTCASARQGHGTQRVSRVGLTRKWECTGRLERGCAATTTETLIVFIGTLLQQG